MAQNKKLKTIFINQNEFDQFVLATIADCAAIGSELSKYGEGVTQEVVDQALGVAYSRFSLILGEHARRFMNGETPDLLKQIKEEDFDTYRKNCNEFSAKVMKESKDANKGKEPEVPAEADPGDAKKD